MSNQPALKYAHSENALGEKETVFTHLTRVADLAEAFTDAWGSPWEGRAAGLLHDLGKYGALFQARLAGREKKVDHSTPGALAALEQYRMAGLAAVLAIQGHHGGLRSAHRLTLLESLRMATEASGGRRYSERDTKLLLAELRADGGTLPPPGRSRIVESIDRGLWDAAMLDARMVFSALVDADYLATTGHFEEGAAGYQVNANDLALEPARALELVLQYVDARRAQRRSSDEMQELRDDLLRACLQGAEQPPGLFTLTAPTGAGKTLAMLAFALQHAARHGLRRVVVVLPYLTIIDQTAGEFKRIFRPLGSGFVLEDHSLAGEPRSSPEKAEAAADADDRPETLRALTQNWDAPVIVTTTVRFFEALFANRPADCRKLHNLARSVIMFDEAQTMPVPLAVPTLAALAQLRSHYGCTVLFSTATQPALREVFDSAETKRRRSFAGWRPVELASPELRLFERARRVQIAWPEAAQAETDWEELARQLTAVPQSLAIVNLRRHATHLFELVQAIAPDGARHLSTNMCPAHRKDTLDRVRAALDAETPCHLVSTQCVEAGVDIDFPAVWRALAPLDAVAQAAGRCNREGKQASGVVTVFLPPLEKTLYPSPHYEHAAMTLRQMLMLNPALDILNPETVYEYFRRYYAVDEQSNAELEQAICALDFVGTADNYRWIPGDGVSVLVPYAPQAALFRQLADQARAGEMDAAWMRQARPLAVSLRTGRRNPILDCCEEVTRKGEATGWYMLLDEKAYDAALGLVGDSDPDRFFLF